jgi:hypothetical protein
MISFLLQIYLQNIRKLKWISFEIQTTGEKRKKQTNNKQEIIIACKFAYLRKYLNKRNKNYKKNPK